MTSRSTAPFSALYLHIPFCRSKCLYCDFDSSPTARAELARVVEPYVQNLCERIDRFGDEGLLDGVETVYIGGGTPSILGERLVGIVEHVLGWCVPREFTCEANPESFDVDLAWGLKRAGVSRISLGVQCLNDAELKQIGRRHDAERALEAVSIAKTAGFDVSIDLMCGLPSQTDLSWEATLEGAIAAGVDHVSVYPLAIEEGTPLARLCARGKLDEPDEDFQARCMERAREVLACAGFEPYEVASYARPGKRCRHNIAYWTGKPYLGIGRSAAGMFDAADACRVSELFSGLESELPGDVARVRTLQRDLEGASFEYEFLSAREAAAEDLMLGCRLTDGMPSGRMRILSEPLGSERVAIACDRAAALGLASWRGADGTEIANLSARSALEQSGLSFAPTQRGWLEGNVLFELFWELA